MCKSVCGHTFFFILGKYIEVGFWGQHNFLRNCQTVSKWLYHFAFFPPAMYESCNYSTFSLTLGVVSFLNLAILVGTHWYLIYDLFMTGILSYIPKD